MNKEEKIKKALEMAKNGGCDDTHHKMWVIDQMVRILTGNEYPEWVKAYEQGNDGPQTYRWNIENYGEK